VKKYAIFYNLDKIPAKLTAVMLAKKCKNQTFFTAVNFVGILAVIAVFFCTEESTPGMYVMSISCADTFDRTSMMASLIMHLGSN
jgi:hypothetical protein